MRLVKSTPHKLKERTAGCQIGFNGLNQYGSAGVNLNIIHAVDYFKDFTICFFLRVIEPHSEKTGNPENAWPWTMYQRFDAGTVFRYNGFGIVTSKSGAPSGKYRMRFIMGRDRPYEGYVAGEANTSYHKGALYHIAITYNSTSLFQFYVNGVKMPMHPTAKLGSGVIQGSIWDYGYSPFLLGTGLDLHNIHSYYSENNISHFMVFNRILEHSEIKPIARKGRISQSARCACVAHYPCTQPNGLQILDTVDQLNHVKPLMLSKEEANIFIVHADRVSRSGKKYTITNNAGTATAIHLDRNGILTGYESDDGVVVHLRYRTNDIWFTYARYESTTSALYTQNLGNTAGEWQEAYFYWKHDYTADIATRANIFLSFNNGGGLGSAYAVGSYIEFDFIRISKQLKPFHADLINFTDLETGASLSSSNQAWKDFYKKGKNYLGNHFQISNYFGTSNTHDYYFYSNHHEQWALGSEDFAFEATFSCSSYEGMYITPFYKPDTNWVYLRVHAISGLIFEIYWNGGANHGRIVAVQPVSELFIPGKIHTLGVQKITNDAANWKLILDGRELDVVIVANTLGDTVLNSSGTLRFFNTASATFTLRAYETKFTVGNVVRGHWQWNNRAGTIIRDLSGHSDITLRVPDTPELYHGGKYWRENDSDKPPVIHAMRFRKANSQYLTVPNFVPTMEQGYTTVVGFALESNRDFHNDWHDHFFSKRQSSPHRYIGHVGYFTGSNFIHYRTSITGTPKAIYVRLEKLNLLISTWQREGLTDVYTWNLYLNGTLIHTSTYGFSNSTQPDFSLISGDLLIGSDPNFIGSRHLDGYLFYTAIAKGVISQKEVSQIHNHSLFKQPGKSSNLDWQLIVNYNRIINTGSVYQLEDLSGKGHIITMRNFSANNITSGHVDYCLTPVHNLR